MNRRWCNWLIGISAGIVQVLFLPVFVIIVLRGNAVRYNELHKITALYSNPRLFLYAVGIMILFAVLYKSRSKIKYNKNTIIGTVLFSACVCFIFLAVKIYISKCIAFYGGWDCGMVADSARWVYHGEDLGHDDYLYIYHNNIPITWLLYKLYCLANSIAYPYNPEFIWIQFQCAMFAVSLFLVTMLVLAIKKEIAPAIMTVLGGGIFLGLCPWQIIPYSDGATIAIPVFVLCLYIGYRRAVQPMKSVIWLVLVFFGVLGGIIKATCYIPLIAAAVTEAVIVLTERTDFLVKGQKLMFRLILGMGGVTLAIMCRNVMYRELDYVPVPEWQMTWSNYMYVGLNEETTGACSGDGLEVVHYFQENNPNGRKAQERALIRQRIAEKGLGGLVDFWIRKEVMNFNDGTFTWYQEGFFQAWNYPEFPEMEGAPFKEKLREFYWQSGGEYIYFVTSSQTFWLFIQFGMILEALFVLKTSLGFRKGKGFQNDDGLSRMLLLITFIGVYLFVCLFEGRARYLINSLPVFCVISLLGYSDIFKIGFGLKMRVDRKDVFGNETGT